MKRAYILAGILSLIVIGGAATASYIGGLIQERFAEEFSKNLYIAGLSFGAAFLTFGSIACSSHIDEFLKRISNREDT